MERISVVVVDDHPLFRQGVIDALSLNSELNIVGQAATGEEGLNLIRKLKPDVAVVDVNLPGINGTQIARHISQEKIPSRVIFLTAYDDTEQKINAMNLGVAAYCSKDILPEKLVWVIHQVSQGDFVFDEKIISQGDLELVAEKTAKEIVDHPLWGREAYQPLSGREMQVLDSITRGLSNKEIALQLEISQQTVKNHITTILRKLNVSDRTQAAVYALKRGWVRLDQGQDFIGEKGAE